MTRPHLQIEAFVHIVGQDQAELVERSARDEFELEGWDWVSASAQYEKKLVA